MTPWVQLQFNIGRLISYIPFMFQAQDQLFSFRNNMRTADELCGTPEIPTDDVFISQVIQRSPITFYTENTADKLITDISRLDDIDTFDKTYYEVNRVEVDKETSEITIFTKDDPKQGKPGGPITRKKDGGAKFQRAMQHAMTCLNSFVTVIGHSWVHFLFPDAVAAVVHNDVDSRSVLYKLLEPHTRYSSFSNYGAIAASATIATTAAPRGQENALEKQFEPWTPWPVSAGEFTRKNSERTTDYYFSDEFACPPKWFEGPSAELPYIKSLKRFYPIVRDHVTKVLQFEDFATIDKFIADVDNATRVDGKSLDLTRFDPVDVIATLIFDASFIHSTDHYFGYRVYHETRFSIGTLRHPLEREWYPGSRVPEDILDDDDRVRSQGFFNIFGKFNDNKFISNSMASLKYKFVQKELKTAGKELIAAIEAEQEKMKIDGDMFCPLKDVARSLCF
eukprot:CAMPEP_0171930546 /NCGR_PEP_ID=MMETSP0993-20121228/28679_1 /TAXON_ID=483369 /ORGANISM="non described non described, Strain CCMP2098" /LENGTH=450 /DNA_ID=CAMNT_0012570381 /DNA_START=120 /DNA_END=1472 /DNA_ORIENTATION=-